MDTKEFSSNKSDLKGVWVFFTLALLISWAIWIFMILFIPKDNHLPFILIGGFGPFLSAIITIWIFEGKVSVRNWLKRTFKIKINPLWYLIGSLLLPILIGLIFHGVYTSCRWKIRIFAKSTLGNLYCQLDFHNSLRWWQRGARLARVCNTEIDEKISSAYSKCHRKFFLGDLALTPLFWRLEW